MNYNRVLRGGGWQYSAVYCRVAARVSWSPTQTWRDIGFRCARGLVSTATAPSAPTNVAASDGTYTNKVLIIWSSVTNATGYEVWWNTSSSTSSASKMASTTNTTYDDTSATAGMTYYYWIKATNAGGTSAFSSSDSGYWTASTNTAVHPDVKVNNSDGPLSLNSSGTLSVKVSLPDGSGSGASADWWVAADTPVGLYWYTAAGWTLNGQPVYQGPLVNVSAVEILTIGAVWLPHGTYTFYFAVDTTMNGQVDWATLSYDAATVTIQ